MSIFTSIKELTNSLMDIVEESANICTTSVSVVAISLTKINETLVWVKEEMTAIEIMEQQRTSERKSTTLDEL